MMRDNSFEVRQQNIFEAGFSKFTPNVLGRKVMIDTSVTDSRIKLTAERTISNLHEFRNFWD
jgi:hypothetical protein